MLERQKMAAASQSFKLLFQKTIQTAKESEVVGLAKLLCIDAPGSDFEEIYRWFDGFPTMRHWIGDRVYHRLKAEGYSVKLRPYEASLEVLTDDILFDRLGGYSATIRKMAVELKLHPWREAVAAIQDGFSGASYGLCFDGYCLFSASHSTGSNTSTSHFSRTALAAGVLAMRQQADPLTGDNLLINPTHVWYHPDLEETISDVLDKDYVIDSTGSVTESNKWKGRFQKLPLQGLTSSATNYWGLLALNEGEEFKPLIHRHMGTGQFVAKDDAKDDSVFERREAHYGIDHWMRIAPAFPQYIWGSTGAA